MLAQQQVSVSRSDVEILRAVSELFQKPALGIIVAAETDGHLAELRVTPRPFRIQHALGRKCGKGGVRALEMAGQALDGLFADQADTRIRPARELSTSAGRLAVAAQHTQHGRARQPRLGVVRPCPQRLLKLRESRVEGMPAL